MRIIHLLLIGILISLAAALTKVENTQAAKTKSRGTTKHSTTTIKPTTAVASKEPIAKQTAKTEDKATKTTRSRTAKLLKGSSANAPSGDKRGKRTLYDFENAGYLYPDIVQRRAGYDNQDSRAYYPQSGYYNGQNAIAQFPADFGGHYGPYPQYLEAPEPIIEIIIKDSNETIPTDLPQPIVTKKKKEKVHVFYVNYKKDENNKLHLESPIASLNNDDTDEEEEEEIVHYPAAVTPLPPLRATTLRTIIHPDSEKYHSNSGIHVTFGSEDKSQTGHILEEHDAESIQRQVVALPVGGVNVGSGVKTTDSYNTRADYLSTSSAMAAQGRSPNGNKLFTAPFLQSSASSSSASSLFQTNQQLPAQHTQNYFRPPVAQNQPPSSSNAATHFYQKHQPQQQQQHHHQQQQQHQRPSFNTATPQSQAQALYRKPFPPPPQQQLQQQHQSHYYTNHNQQYQQQQQQQQQQQTTNQQNQFYHALSHKPMLPPNQQVFFPTAPSKQQELPSRQTPAPYQPIKFRPTPVPQIKPVVIPAKLENTNYQSQQQQQQSHHQQLQYQQSQHQQQKQQQHQQQPYQFNRQPQFVQQPSFSVPSPTLPNYYKPVQNQHQQSHQNVQPTTQYLQQKPQTNKYQTSSQQSHQSSSSDSSSQSSLSSTLQNSGSLGAIHNFFGVQPSKETELLKSIPKFEQHITETIHHGLEQQQSEGNFHHFGYNAQNQVLHDIPAPNLGPTALPLQSQQSQYNSIASASGATNSPLNGHYITAASSTSSHSQQQQFSNFVTTSNSVGASGSGSYAASSTTAPQYAEATDGQKIMIVTPMPELAYTQQYQPQQYNNQGSSSSGSQTYRHSPSLQTKASTNFAQQPRQSATAIHAATSNANAQFSVSTLHSDVFKELQQRQHQQTLFGTPSSKTATQTEPQKSYIPTENTAIPATQQQQSRQPQQPTTATPLNNKGSQTLLQLPDEVPDDLRQQLLSSGILNNADISILDYDKVGDVALENLPAEHLQHFYGAGGGAQISESKKVVTVVKPNGDKVSLSEKEIERVKESNSLPHKQNVDVKVVHFDANNEKSVTGAYLKADATVVPPVDLSSDRQYNRYLPLKINGAQFPIPDSEELRGKKVVSVVVLAPVDASSQTQSAENVAISDSESRIQRDAQIEGKEVKFVGGDLIKTLVKKPTKENFKRWLEKEARTDVEQQSVVLLVAKSAANAEQEIFMYDITSGAVSKLNGELSSAFVNVAEENASTEDLEHASTLDPSVLETMMHKSRR